MTGTAVAVLDGEACAGKTTSPLLDASLLPDRVTNGVTPGMGAFGNDDCDFKFDVADCGPNIAACEVDAEVASSGVADSSPESAGTNGEVGLSDLGLERSTPIIRTSAAGNVDVAVTSTLLSVAVTLSLLPGSGVRCSTAAAAAAAASVCASASTGVVIVGGEVVGPFSAASAAATAAKVAGFEVSRKSNC